VELSQVDLNKLHTFFTVAEQGGVTAAGRKLALTPSAVSQSLSTLEQSLGIRLFDRVGRRLVLTREGRVLQARFRDHQRALQETLSQLVDDTGPVRGLVRLGLSLGVPRQPVAELLSHFSERHPGATTRVYYAPHADLNEGLLEGRIDYVLSFDPEGEALGRIRSLQLFSQELVLVSTKRWWKRSFSFEQLQQVPIVDYYQSAPLIHRWVQHHYRRKAPKLDIRSWAATTDLALELILRDVGVGVLPRKVAAPYLKSKRLRRFETGRPEVIDFIWLKELANAWRGPALAAFREVAIDELASSETNERATTSKKRKRA
jgi:DNA-binding transcriptional LysR family regulator